MEKKIYSVNVLGPHGYSFAVLTSETSEEAIIHGCISHDIFQDTEDAEYANIEDISDDFTARQHLAECTYEI